MNEMMKEFMKKVVIVLVTVWILMAIIVPKEY